MKNSGKEYRMESSVRYFQLTTATVFDISSLEESKGWPIIIQFEMRAFLASDGYRLDYIDSVNKRLNNSDKEGAVFHETVSRLAHGYHLISYSLKENVESKVAKRLG
ncbi:unnamed protein product [Haemonchus placei]|uniref:Phage protein n=1 Tax=Haemonchus placei TaxID=6290 RepID=A0A0N4WKN9_HAEPC|nr:unnamed protein product [Haemonchus placei]